MDLTAPNLAFIVGMSRGGTTWMSNTLSNHPDIAVFGESLYWGRAYIQPNGDGYYSKKQIQAIKNRLVVKGILGHGVGRLKQINKENIGELLDFATEQLPEHATPGDVFLSICIAIAKFESKKMVIEKTPHHVNNIELIRKYFPSAKFIIMYRPPYDFMLSS